jgi:hypothetical protein
MENRQGGLRAYSTRHCWLISNINRTVVFSNHGGLCKGLMDEHNSLVLLKKMQFYTSSLPVFLSQSHCDQNTVVTVFFSNTILKGILSNAQIYTFESYITNYIKFVFRLHFIATTDVRVIEPETELRVKKGKIRNPWKSLWKIISLRNLICRRLQENIATHYYIVYDHVQTSEVVYFWGNRGKS